MRWDVARDLDRTHGLPRSSVFETLYRNETWAPSSAVAAIARPGSRPPTARSKRGRAGPSPLHEEWRLSQRAIEPNLQLVRDLRGSHKLGILSNADVSLRGRLEGEIGIHALFDDIVCSAEVGMAKPEPGIYTSGCRAARASARPVRVRGRSRHQRRGRAGVGMQAVLFRWTRATTSVRSWPRSGSCRPADVMPRSAIFLSPGADLAAAVDLARRADAAGYESVWVTHGVGRDGLQVLSAYAHAAPRVGLGTGVLPIYPRHPVLLAQEALTLQEVSGGRLRLGIGVSHRPVMEGALGLEMGKPLEVAREYVAVLRQALTGRVQHTGPRYQVTWQSGVPRLPAPPPSTSPASARPCSSSRVRSPTARCCGCALPPTCASTRCPPSGAGASGRASHWTVSRSWCPFPPR